MGWHLDSGGRVKQHEASAGRPRHLGCAASGHLDQGELAPGGDRGQLCVAARVCVLVRV